MNQFKDLILGREKEERVRVHQERTNGAEDHERVGQATTTLDQNVGLLAPSPHVLRDRSGELLVRPNTSKHGKAGGSPALWPGSCLPAVWHMDSEVDGRVDYSRARRRITATTRPKPPTPNRAQALCSGTIASSELGTTTNFWQNGGHGSPLAGAAAPRLLTSGRAAGTTRRSNSEHRVHGGPWRRGGDGADDAVDGDQTSIDTGNGPERVMPCSRQKQFPTRQDLFTPLLADIGKNRRRDCENTGTDENSTDIFHARRRRFKFRSTTCLIGDGVTS